MTDDEVTKRFEHDIREHELEVVREDGLYRHLRCRRPGTFAYGFDILTWPGWLAVTGDMGAVMFTRLPDMFEFFRGSGRPDFSYWAEKMPAESRDSARRYEPELFEQIVRERAAEYAAERVPEERRGEFHGEVEEVVRAAHDGEHEAVRAAMDFRFDGREVFCDVWEHNLREYTFHFLWLCYAIRWAIARFDTRGASPAALQNGEIGG